MDIPIQDPERSERLEAIRRALRGEPMPAEKPQHSELWWEIYADREAARSRDEELAAAQVELETRVEQNEAGISELRENVRTEIERIDLDTMEDRAVVGERILLAEDRIDRLEVSQVRRGNLGRPPVVRNRVLERWREEIAAGEVTVAELRGVKVAWLAQRYDAPPATIAEARELLEGVS
jgi:hypothetical protein